MANILPGTIILWSGTTANIPNGWLLCNGSNGTPNLQDKFIVGAGSTYAVNATGGENNVTLAGENLPSHNHPLGTLSLSSSGQHQHTYTARVISPGNQYNHVGGGGPRASFTTTYTSGTSGTHTHSTITGNTGSTGSSGAHENRPAFRALVYIMKA